MSRDYDLVLFGATGFTGGMTAAYLARHASAKLRWAIAGRSERKLQAVKQTLLAIEPRCTDVGIVLASVDDPGSLARMAASTRVVLTTVGPFIDYGEPVVAACVEQGTDYIDSTGEPYFVQRMLARYAQPAAAKGVRLIPSCGFDSMPADLGALFTVSQLPTGKPIELDGFVSLKGVFSGGTERSAIKSVVPPKDRLAQKALLPNGLPSGLPSSGRRVVLLPAKVAARPELGGWSAPLETIDASVVMRSATSLDRYGPQFSYRHHVVHPSFGVMLAAFVLFGSLAFLARFAPIRALFLKLVKPSGAGPSEAQMAQSWFKVRFIAQCEGQRVQTEVSGGDPGYGETSKMLAEAALCLIEDRDQLPARAGVLTPAEAFGETLIARLQRAGLRFALL